MEFKPGLKAKESLAASGRSLSSMQRVNYRGNRLAHTPSDSKSRGRVGQVVKFGIAASELPSASSFLEIKVGETALERVCKGLSGMNRNVHVPFLGEGMPGNRLLLPDTHDCYAASSHVICGVVEVFGSFLPVTLYLIRSGSLKIKMRLTALANCLTWA